MDRYPYLNASTYENKLEIFPAFFFKYERSYEAMKIKLTFQQYDRMVENIKKTDMQPEGFWPTIAQIQAEIEPNIRKNLPFLIWLTEYNPAETLSPEDAKSRKYILKLLYKNLELFDSDN